MERKKILVVDDEPEMVALLKTRLSANGYEVATAYKGAEALEKARASRPDLILLDILMPGLDGIEVSQVLKKSDLKEVPVIFITALRKKREQESRGDRVGGNLIFAKPFKAEELLAKIQEALGAVGAHGPS